MALDLGAVLLVRVQFGKFNETYGSLGRVIGFMWISAIVILLGGAELDAEGASDRARYHDRLPEANVGMRTRLKRPRAGDAGPMASKSGRSSAPEGERNDNLRISLCCGRDRICREFEVARTVLVVDDDPLVLEVTADMLKDLGCEVVTAASGMDALERLSENANVDVLITDLNMPGMDGYELAQRAAATRPGLQVIMLSGREIDGRGWPVVRKPFLEEDLAHTMKQTTGLC